MKSEYVTPLSSPLRSGACWIWSPDPNDAKPHRYVRFRAGFQLRSVPSEARALLAVDSDFVFWLNGREVGRGQFSDYPERKTWTEFDVGAHLRPGHNIVAILAYFRGEDFSEHRAGRPGLIFTLWADGVAVCRSEANWKTRAHPAYRPGPMPRVTPQMGFTACYDARLEEDWLAADFPDADWEHAACVNGSSTPPERGLHRRPLLPLLLLEPVPAGVLRRGPLKRKRHEGRFSELVQADLLDGIGSGNMFPNPEPDAAVLTHRGGGVIVPTPPDGWDGYYLIVDLGREETGLLSLKLNAPAATVVDIAHGEHLLDGRVRASLGARNFADRFICREGENKFTLSFRRLGCRYLELHFTGYSRPIVLRYAGLRPVEYALERRGSFSASDRRAEAIWRIGIRTLQVCMHEHYEDTPWREQALYAQDSRNQALYGYYPFGNYDFAAVSFDLLGQGMREDGLLELCAPARAPITIPAFSYIWIAALSEHYLHSGRPDLFEKHEGPVRALIDNALARTDPETHLVKPPEQDRVWHFYEWVPGMNSPSGQGALDGRLDAPYVLFVLEAMEAFARMLTWRQRQEEAAEIRARAADLKSAFLRVFFDASTGLVRSMSRHGRARGSHELVQALVLATGTCGESMRGGLLKALASQKLERLSLASMLYLLRAMMNGTPASRAALAARIRAVWGAMLDSGTTTFWEVEQGPDAFGGAGSVSHAWSALPVYYYHAYVLGVRPEEPGFRRFVIQPYADNFSEAGGKITTPHGSITISWRRRGKGLDVTCQAPENLIPRVQSHPECPVIKIRMT